MFCLCQVQLSHFLSGCWMIGWLILHLSDFLAWCGMQTRGWLETRGIEEHGSRGHSLKNAAPEDCNQTRQLSHSGLRVASTNQILVRADLLNQNVLNYFWLKMKGKKINPDHQRYFKVIFKLIIISSAALHDFLYISSIEQQKCFIFFNNSHWKLYITHYIL